MDVIFNIIIMAFIGGFIGYLTNVVAVKMLFRPLEPIKIPIIGFEIVGLIPKRRAEIAQNVAQIVRRELLNEDDIFDGIIKEDDKDKVIEFLDERVSSIVAEKAVFLPNSIVDMINSYLSDIVKKEASSMIDNMSEEFVSKAKERVDIEKIIEDRINSFDLEELEEMTIRIAKNELKHIELMGLLLGVLIGTLQGVISIFI